MGRRLGRSAAWGLAFNESLETSGNVRDLQVAAPTQLDSNVARYVLRPCFSGVECDDATRIAILPVEQIDNHATELGSSIDRAIGSGSKSPSGQRDPPFGGCENREAFHSGCVN